jgi:hypothetical protein
MTSHPGSRTDPRIYDLLATQQANATTVSQLHQAVKDTYIQDKNIDFWAGVITVSRALKESREYGGGLPIPEASGIESVTVGDGASGTIKPSGTEVWQVSGLNLDNCIAFLTDGSGMITLVLGGDNATTTGPLYLTPTMYIGFQNASGSEQTPSIAYHKVGL